MTRDYRRLEALIRVILREHLKKYHGQRLTPETFEKIRREVFDLVLSGDVSEFE